MGTRNLTIVRKNGQDKVYQYGQWDGYLSGQGHTVYNFCSNRNNLDILKDKLDNIQLGWSDDAPEFASLREKDKVFDEPNNRKTWKDVYNEKESNWAYNFTHRDVCADILDNIVNTDFYTDLPEEFNGKLFLVRYTPEKNFENYHDIWIEYAYIIDFDTERLEVWAYGKKIKDCNLYDLPDKDTFLTEPEDLFDDDDDDED